MTGVLAASVVWQADLKLWPFRVVSDGTKDDKPLIEPPAGSAARCSGLAGIQS